ncbi:MAG: ribosome recycling factor [Patescibacteria group bacterium]
MSIVDDQKPEFTKAIHHYTEDLKSLRTGRANPAMIENVLVESYGAKMPLKQVASIAGTDAKTLTVDPWDKSIIKEVEKGLGMANLGFSVINEGKLIRLVLAPLTEESRLKLIKVAKEKTEAARINIRSLRDRARDEILKQEKNKEITEDDRYNLQKKLDELTTQFNDQIKTLSEEKEKEIMTV